MNTKFIAIPAIALAAGLSLTACGGVHAGDPTQPITPAPTPTVTQTVVAPPPVHLMPVPAPPLPPPTVTDPWAVVSAYYGLIKDGNFQAAWAMQSRSFQGSNGNFQSWVNGYACTGAQHLSENGESGHTVYVNLSVVNNCLVDDETQYFIGWFIIDNNGLITARHYTLTGTGQGRTS